MKKFITFPFILLIASLCLADSVTGTYSSLHYQEEGGDLLGQELTIVVGAKGEYYGILQCAEGSPDVPMVIPVKIKKGTIKFKVPKDNDHLNLCPQGTFSGQLTDKEINGEFETQSYKIKLKKGKSYWQ